MNYYEELGLKPTATVQEIRQAYKVLARLVHPDGQANEPVRHMAERQMKRLNEILATLANEQSRREYDARLEIAPLNSPSLPVPLAVIPEPEVWLPGKSRPAPPEWLRPLAEHWFWIALAAVVSGVGIWYAVQVGSEDGMKAAANQAALSEVPSIEHKDARTARQRGARRHPETKAEAPAERPNDRRAVERERRPSAPAHPDSEISPADPNPVEPAPIPAAPAMKPAASLSLAVPATAPPPRETKLNASLFAGNWLFVPDPNDKTPPGLYPATYVELLLGEDRGRLRGTYRAEFNVADRAVSPQVAFAVECDVPAGAKGRFQWSAPDGAKGDGELTLSGTNILKITWWTTQFGRHTALASGMSKLIRQVTP